MRKGILLFVIFILLLVGPTAVRYLRFYDLNPLDRTAPLTYDPASIGGVPTPSSSAYVEEPKVSEGLVLLDMAHANNFSLDDIAYLDGRLATRGVELLPYTGGDLSLALRTVNALIAITPLNEYTAEEILAITNFVDRGGKLVLVGDPTRFNQVFDEDDPFAETVTIEADHIPLNSLANQFDLIFNGDYLYNTVENEGNFRNIILRDVGFAENGLTEGLLKLAFYSAHSLQVGPTGTPLIIADDNTWSSATDRSGGLTLAALSQQGRVLALGDIHFLIQPYFTVFDNSRFIAHIADFLAESTGRQLSLMDFPYFFQGPVYLVYTGSPDLGPDAFDEIIAVQEAFRRVDRDLSLAATDEAEADTLFLGLYNQAEDVGEMLAAAGISLTIEPPISAIEPSLADEDDPDSMEEETEQEETAVRLLESDLSNIEMSGTALILLNEENDRRRVVVLAASAQGLENTVNRLLSLMPLNADYALSDCLLQDNLALCPTLVAEEAVEYELISTDMPDEDGADEEVEDEADGEDNVSEDVENGDELAGILQGTISAGQTVTGTLAEEETHSWLFVEGPATVDMILGGEELDGVLTIYGPDGEQLFLADNGITGDEEQLLGIDIPDDGEYTITVHDFFGRIVDYYLTVDLLSEEG